jgi:hypothetical protein
MRYHRRVILLAGLFFRAACLPLKITLPRYRLPAGISTSNPFAKFGIELISIHAVSSVLMCFVSSCAITQ